MAVIDVIAEHDPRLLIPVAERILMPILENAIVLVPEAEDRFRSWAGRFICPSPLPTTELHPWTAVVDRGDLLDPPKVRLTATLIEENFWIVFRKRGCSVASYLRELAIFHAAIPKDRPLGNQTWVAYALRDALECAALSIRHSRGGTAFLPDYVARESTAWPISPPTQYGRNLGGLGARLLARFEAVYRETVEELAGAMENVAGFQAFWTDAPYLLSIVRDPCIPPVPPPRAASRHRAPVPSAGPPQPPATLPAVPDVELAVPDDDDDSPVPRAPYPQHIYIFELVFTVRTQRDIV
ncbi:hypothetical protein FA95DRAFT_1613159 [Auriscalpium vulgare]|uniref:Uncharacterized protein n=1 Tax=Auriscalpium vulgare TaxID=40419 RepID=A0ACB8R541_9AGAM|nr:hypothetical protein FA95DRAFT_1613159 [Auriscalpium vulgare]